MAVTQSSFWLVVKEGPEPGRKIDLTGHSMLLGRDPAADIVLDSPAVSRQHARIALENGVVCLEDLSSSNGTFINQARIQGKVMLKPGDRIGLGQSVLLELAGLKTLAGDVAGAMAETVISSAAQQKTLLGAKPDVGAGPVQPPQFEVIIAGEAKRVYDLDQPQFSVGRSEDSDIVIPSPIVSRRLATLKQTPNGYLLVVNPQVSNPVLFDGRPLTGERLLQHGDQLRIGSLDPGLMVTLRYLAPNQAALQPQLVAFGNKQRVAIGRDPANDVVLSSPQVSRFHAEIERVGQRYRVTDLHSANGTFVNDQPISGTIWLKPNDTLRIGSNRFIVYDAGLSRVDESGGLRVEAVGLNKWVRKNLNLLKDISLVFEPREFIVVVGQSGGGKSTLVDAIAGYRPATHGHVLVNGIDTYRSFDAVRNEIGFVPQKDIIHMELTVYQALDYAARLRMPADTTPAERHKRILQVLDDLDLAHRKDVQISGLSGGQQKRVSIGVELLTQPGLFFLDEPTSGLDPGTETALMQLMRRLADQGRTIVMITHATKNVMLADKVVFLARGGYLAWFGPPDEALAFFDPYRTERDRRARSIEFDEIYAILDDPSKGKGEDWAERYRKHPAYQRYIIEPLSERGHVPDAARDLPQAAGRSAAHTGQPAQVGRQPVKGNGHLVPATGVAAPAAASPPALGSKPAPKKRRRNQVSGLRQFFILSARNARILVRDRPSLVLMLLVAPILASLDIILSFVLGRDLFSYQDGNIASVVTSLFMPIMYSVMVGALAQMREFVKEAEIYRRERLVNLKVLPYVLSKVWVAALLALYQAFVYTAIHYAAFKMPGGMAEFGAIYVTLYLATLAGMMLGLASSALAPNANAVPLIVILFLVPQFVLGGAMIPVPSYISAPTSARWAFEALMAVTGPGSDVAGDVCWDLPEELRDNMSLDDKEANGCRCMGLNALDGSSCSFPGIGKSYDPVLDEPEPVAPAELGDPPPDPVIPPPPPEPGNNADAVEMATYLRALQDYQAEVEKIQNAFKAEMKAYQARSELFKEQATAYQEALSEWNIERNSAVGEAEGLIKPFYTDFGWTFVDKNDQQAYWRKITSTWISQGVIIAVLMVLSILLIWRKDRA